MTDGVRLLDLFSCAGDAGMGCYRAGFEVVGVDIDPQPNYPFDIVKHDALTLDWDWDWDWVMAFDAIHASPPCQSYSDLAKRNKNAIAWPRLVEPVREMLEATGKPWIIENVQGGSGDSALTHCATRAWMSTTNTREEPDVVGQRITQRADHRRVDSVP